MANLHQKLYDLKHQRAGFLKNAQDALGRDDMNAYKTAMDQAAALVDQIDAQQALINEMARYQDGEPQGGIQPQQRDQLPKSVTDMLASREYARTFCMAMRLGLNPIVNRGDERISMLMNALQETGGSPEGADGGFLVPADMQTRINEVRRQQVALADYFTTEVTGSRTGFRIYDTAPTKGFTKVAEMGNISKDDQPKFQRVDFTVEDYALIVPLSNDLLADETAGLMAYLANWMGRKSVLTENINLLALLAALSATDIPAGEEMKGLKTALNTGLDPAISQTSVMVTNQSGYNVLDNLTDKNGRYLLQPDPTQPRRMLFAGRPVVALSDSLLANESEKAPVYVGDLSQYGTLIRRQNMELATTNIGGSAWGTNSTEARAIMRMDEIKTDGAAALKRTLSLTGAGA